MNEIIRYITALADDELILGHRDSEWTGYAPILEEDIAFSNIAQDEIGHALALYTLAQELGGKTRMRWHSNDPGRISPAVGW